MDVTSLALGGYGAALSTYLGVLKFKEGRRSIRLFVRDVGSAQLPYFAVHIVNSGTRPVRLMSDGFLLDDGNGAHGDEVEMRADMPEGEEKAWVGDSFPVLLTDGEPCGRLFHLDPLRHASSLPRYYYVEDSEDRQWKVKVPDTTRRWAEANRKR